MTDVREWHRRQVESQVIAKHFADEFDKTSVPKKVDFIMPYCIEMCRRAGKPWFNVEVMMTPGKHGHIDAIYAKHNSNAGAVLEDRTGGRGAAANHGEGFIRNTPQAYSHFTL